MFKGTTIVAVRNNNSAAIAGDGQITLGQNTVFKNKANKIRKIYNETVMVGFAGSVADAITLYEKFENKLEEYNGNLKRGAIELAKEWRSDRVLKKLEAMLIAVDKNNLLVISGGGEVIEPDDNIAAIGSGGNYALSAGRALIKHSKLTPKEIVVESMKIASSVCVYTNDIISCEIM